MFRWIWGGTRTWTGNQFILWSISHCSSSNPFTSRKWPNIRCHNSKVSSQFHLISIRMTHKFSSHDCSGRHYQPAGQLRGKPSIDALPTLSATNSYENLLRDDLAHARLCAWHVPSWVNFVCWITWPGSWFSRFSWCPCALIPYCTDCLKDANHVSWPAAKCSEVCHMKFFRFRHVQSAVATLEPIAEPPTTDVIRNLETQRGSQEIWSQVPWIF